MAFLPNNTNGGGIAPGAVSNQPAPMPGRAAGGFVGNQPAPMPGTYNLHPIIQDHLNSGSQIHPALMHPTIINAIQGGQPIHPAILDAIQRGQQLHPDVVHALQNTWSGQPTGIGGGLAPGAGGGFSGLPNQPTYVPGRAAGGFVGNQPAQVQRYQGGSMGNGQLFNGGNQQAPNGMFRGL